MNTIQVNIEKSARIADIAVKIAWILLWIVIVIFGGVFLLTLLIYAAAGPEGFSMFITAENVLEIFGPGVVLPAGVSPLDMFVRTSAVFLVSAIVYVGLLAAMLRSMGQIFSEVRKTLLPFTAANAQRLKKAAIYMALVAVVPYLIGVVGSLIIGVYVELIPFGFELLIASAVIYCLAHIFEYGVLLQQQADETL
ncbi:hypothetical protein [Methanorbis furvi]|uniref:DUF2975 domain-containing protein n=1 Tax=Methanorbis furvi TaxID=3028299 RepID=A0AAE4SA05_9EURY|nr:hypothetical protein [Methanocorpusculaceae archaeon Ag1]